MDRSACGAEAMPADRRGPAVPSAGQPAIVGHEARLATAALLLALPAASRQAAHAATPAADATVRHEFVIHDFHIEGGAVLPQARIVRDTDRTPDPQGRNAIPLPSHVMPTCRTTTG